MIRTSTPRSSASRQLRAALSRTSFAPASRATYNPTLELSATELGLIDGAVLSLSEERIARILAFAAGK